MEQTQHLEDVILNAICDSEQPTARFVLYKILADTMGTDDETILSDQMDLIISILMDDDFIIEEESSNELYYRATLSGIEFRKKGGYAAELAQTETKESRQEQYDRKQQDGYISPKYALIVSCIALITTIVIFMINRNSNNASEKRMEIMERRVDSLQRK